MMLGRLSLSLSLIFRRLQLGSRIGFLLLQQGLTLFRFPDFLLLAGVVECQGGTARDQEADDDVFLQATQTVALAHDRRFGEDAVDFLERCGRDEGVERPRPATLYHPALEKIVIFPTQGLESSQVL